MSRNEGGGPGSLIGEEEVSKEKTQKRMETSSWEPLIFHANGRVRVGAGPRSMPPTWTGGNFVVISFEVISTRITFTNHSAPSRKLLATGKEWRHFKTSSGTLGSTSQFPSLKSWRAAADNTFFVVLLSFFARFDSRRNMYSSWALIIFSSAALSPLQ